MTSSEDCASSSVERWLKEACAGSVAAQGQVLEMCRKYLLVVANRELDAMLRAKEGASDLVQETLIQAYRGFPKFEGTTRAEILAWLRRILLNNLSTVRRRYAHAENRNVGREVTLDDTGPIAKFKGSLALDTPSPSSRVAAREVSAALDQALETLPGDYREVILLRHGHNLSFADVGELMDRSDDAARKLYVRAIESLRQELKRFGDPS
jgi:RNA polymerase sigma-70 factor, ECF subfamily